MSKISYPDSTLTPGNAVVIFGPQGSGKTTHAHKIAASHGAYTEGGVGDLFRHEGLYRLLASEPTSVVIEGLPMTRKGDARIKALVSAKEIAIRRTHSAELHMVKAPNFIFCTDDENAARRYGASNRRFAVVSLQKGTGDA